MTTKDFQTTKLWKQTVRKLKLLAALTGNSMVEVADRLVDEEIGSLVMILAHKIRLNPTTEQPQHFRQCLGVARFTWNWALAEWDRRMQRMKSQAFKSLSCN
jgi:hypothetical protein